MQTRYIVLVAILAMAHTINLHRTEVPILILWMRWSWLTRCEVMVYGDSHRTPTTTAGGC